MGTVHHNLVLVMLLYGVHTACGDSGAVEHGQSGGLCTVLTCSWCVANFGYATRDGKSTTPLTPLAAATAAAGG
eukprot:COSAG01_NODE_4480_length_4985_cov_15.664142_2_plen_74_part_00